jgi:hypothetical protein
MWQRCLSVPTSLDLTLFLIPFAASSQLSFTTPIGGYCCLSIRLGGMPIWCVASQDTGVYGQIASH